MFEYEGYETLRYPRDQKINPLQLSLDIYARNKKNRIFTTVKTQDESGELVTWTAPSELDAACSALEANDESEQLPVEARLVLVAAQPDDKLHKYIERAQKRGLRIHVAAISEKDAYEITEIREDGFMQRMIKELQINSAVGDSTVSEKICHSMEERNERPLQ